MLSVFKEDYDMGDRFHRKSCDNTYYTIDQRLWDLIRCMRSIIIYSVLPNSIVLAYFAARLS